MKQNSDILEKVGGKTGYTVPDNYFDNVRSKIMASLPDYPKQVQTKLSVWQRIQPYFYMAAMFAGIWCMMKVIHMSGSSDLSLDNPPAAVSLAMADSNHFEWLDVEDESADSFALEEDLSLSYSSIEEFKEDFDNTDI
ncbi:MAG: hypothetical protein J5995_07510 [Muribaculaceae bacterium]|nr:hypothetical protein [Muribaculaceae bacterium]